MKESAIFLSISAIPKIQRSCSPVVRFVTPVLWWTRMVKPLTTAEPDKNSAVRSESPNPAVVPVTTETGTTVRKTEAARNTSRFPMIIDYLSTEIVFLSKRFMPCVPRLSVTTLASSKPVRNGSGFTALMLFRTLIPSLISLCLRLRSPLLSLTQIILYAAWNPLKESLNLLLSYFSTQLCAFLRMVKQNERQTKRTYRKAEWTTNKTHVSFTLI